MHLQDNVYAIRFIDASEKLPQVQGERLKLLTLANVTTLISLAHTNTEQGYRS
jgi:hypothetical protein